ncbi:hypothetical protein TRVL_10040 [Trypanosoma vivax]|nr:hypothetical protein TRVL_10040 [Trypanosoma vivax]
MCSDRQGQFIRAHNTLPTLQCRTTALEPTHLFLAPPKHRPLHIRILHVTIRACAHKHREDACMCFPPLYVTRCDAAHKHTAELSLFCEQTGQLGAATKISRRKSAQQHSGDLKKRSEKHNNLDTFLLPHAGGQKTSPLLGMLSKARGVRS